MPMRMHSSLSATMDLGLLLYSNPLENVLVYLTVGTLLTSLLTTLAPNHVNPAPTHTSTAPTTSAVSVSIID